MVKCSLEHSGQSNPSHQLAYPIWHNMLLLVVLYVLQPDGILLYHRIHLALHTHDSVHGAYFIIEQARGLSTKRCSYNYRKMLIESICFAQNNVSTLMSMTDDVWLPLVTGRHGRRQSFQIKQDVFVLGKLATNLLLSHAHCFSQNTCIYRNSHHHLNCESNLTKYFFGQGVG